MEALLSIKNLADNARFFWWCVDRH